MKSESLDDKKQAAGMTRTGVRMAIISNRMESIARKMQNTLFRTARSRYRWTAQPVAMIRASGCSRRPGYYTERPLTSEPRNKSKTD